MNWVSQAHTEYLAGGLSGAWEEVQGDVAQTHLSVFSCKEYLKGKCPIVITVEEESVEDGGEGGVPHVDQEGRQELQHGGELKV